MIGSDGRRVPRRLTFKNIRAPRPLRFSWSLATAAGAAVADANGDSLYVHRTARYVKAFTGRVNGVVVTEGHRSLRLAELEVERIYLSRVGPPLI